MPNIPTSPTLTWQDMICLHKQNLSLRSVGDEKQALLEQKQGGRGDAISLATFAFPEAENLKLHQESWIGKNSLRAYSILKNENRMDRSYPNDKAILIERFLKGIYHHVEICVKYYKSHAFTLMEVDQGSAQMPYDFGRYFLGKCGTRTFSADNVKKTIINPTTELWDTNTAYAAVITHIRQYCQQFQKQSTLSSIQHGLFTPRQLAASGTEPLVPQSHKCCVIL